MKLGRNKIEMYVCYWLGKAVLYYACTCTDAHLQIKDSFIWYVGAGDATGIVTSSFFQALIYSSYCIVYLKLLFTSHFNGFNKKKTHIYATRITNEIIH